MYICFMELRFKEVAKAKGLTIQDMCKRMGVSYINFNQKINRTPNIDFVQQIADALGVSVFEIIAEDQYSSHWYDANGNWKGVLKNEK